MRMTCVKVLLTACVLSLIICSTTVAKIIYVDDDATGANNGSSWADAFNYLQDALSAAWSGDEIRVARGIYTPDALTPPAPPPPPPLLPAAWINGQSADTAPVDRTATFHLKNGVVIKGGYAGFGEPDPNARDIDMYETTLSGDIGIRGDNSDNSYHVVTGSATDKTAVVDGFVITGGNANGSYPHNRGGGMFNERGCPSLANCTFSGNSTDYSGGGIFNSRSHPMLTNCTLSENSASSNGGGMFNIHGSNPTLFNCAFIHNLAKKGGGMYNWDSRPVLTNCTLSANSAGENGGGMYTYGYSGCLMLTNCVLSGNSARGNGGGMWNEYTWLTLTNCTLTANSASKGNSLACDSWQDYPSDVQVANSILWDGGEEIWNNDRSRIIIIYSDVQSGWPGEGNFEADPCFVEPGYWDAGGVWVDGDFHLLPDSPCINAGDPNHPYDPNETDLDGEPRVIGGRIDMGAYEFQRPCILHVDADATCANDGSSWADAFNYLQDALAAAWSGDEIRVAQGIYKPDQGAGITPGDPRTNFQLKNGVTIKGSYAGYNEPDPNARDIKLYETILSGDLAGNDTEVVDPRDFLEHPSRAENSWHVVTGSGTNATAVLDGFTITGGYALGPSFGSYYLGGGMYNYTGSPTVRNCVFRGNWANIGGGMCNMWHSNPTLSNCRFISNSAHWARGGGMYIGESSPTLTNCLFSGNWAGTRGGGIYCDGPLPPPPKLQGSPAESDLTVTNCTFSSNSADLGGGMHNFRSYPTLTNCVFSGNSAKYEGGGIFYSQTSTTLTNCTFAGNAAPNGNTLACDSYVHSYPSNVELTNCILWDGAYEIYNRDDSTVNITYSDVQGGWPGTGNIDADPCFARLGNWQVEGDYHLKSQAGRWASANSVEPDAKEGRWTRDGVTSPCIDAGDIYSPIGNEPFPNGGRVNMGVHGGTAEASKSYFGKPVCETIVAGDINGDCIVNFKDFAYMALHWLEDNNP